VSLATNMLADTTSHSSNGLAHKSRAHKSRAHIDLTAALNEFRQALTPDQTDQLISSLSHPPTADDVVRLTEQVTRPNAGRKSRLFATRIQGLLESVQQYRNIIDTCTGPNQIAALVWGGLKLVLLVCIPCYLFSYLILTYNASFVRSRQTLPSTSTSCHSA
jgi:hypothetical protein